MATGFARAGDLCLDGDWKFTLVPKPESVSLDHLTGSTDGWASIEVPGCWTMQGFDRPQYTNVQMPFPGPPPSVPRHNPTGVYRHAVSVPDGLGRPARRAARRRGRDGAVRVRRRANPSAWARTPGCPTSSTSRSSSPPGDTFELALVVVRWSDATYLEDQDHWHHAGLHRSVVLYATPAACTSPTCTRRRLDPDTARSAARSVRRRPPAVDARLAHPRCRATVRPPKPRAGSSTRAGWSTRSRSRVAARTLRFALPGVRPWTRRDTRTCTALDGRARSTTTASVVDRVELEVGFRRVEVVGAELLRQRAAGAHQGREPPRPRPPTRQGRHRASRSSATSCS